MGILLILSDEFDPVTGLDVLVQAASARRGMARDTATVDFIGKVGKCKDWIPKYSFSLQKRTDISFLFYSSTGVSMGSSTKEMSAAASTFLYCFAIIPG